MRVGHELARRAGSLGRESLFVESGVCRRRNTGESGSPTRRRRPRIGGLERVLVRARSLRRASVAPHGRGTRPEQPDDRARCFCVGWLINISLARTPAFRGKMSRLLSAFFTRVARAHAGRAPSHSTPAACRPPNSADGRSLASLFLPTPAIHKNPHLGVARAACICPSGAKLGRTIVLNATAPAHGSIKYDKKHKRAKIRVRVRVFNGAQ